MNQTDNKSKLWIARSYLRGYDKSLDKYQKQKAAYNIIDNILQEIIDDKELKTKNKSVVTAKKDAQILLSSLFNNIYLKFKLADLVQHGKIIVDDNRDEYAIKLLEEVTKQEISPKAQDLAKLKLAQIYYAGIFIKPDYNKSENLCQDLLKSTDKLIQIQAKMQLVEIYLWYKFNNEKAHKLLKEISKQKQFPELKKKADDLLKSLSDNTQYIIDDYFSNDETENLI
ncbi:hypothetical protein M1446_01785 [Candidatus Dependentiae bacterium]|nr:hypothetical protein [Candidatus Dependentiae bacterium]